jgi:hypothetical protein
MNRKQTKEKSVIMKIVKIGNKDAFCVKYQIIDVDNIDYLDTEKLKWLYGHLCLYAQNTNIGIYDEWTSFSVIRNYLKDFLNNYKYRFIEESLYNQSKETIFAVLYEQFFSYFQNNINFHTNKYTIENFHSIRDSFHLDDAGEDSFRDKYGIILVNSEKQKKQKLIWRNFTTNELFCVQYEEFFVDNILSLFYDGLKDV